MRCFVCKGPFHPATGGLHGPKNTPFCGMCERSFFAWVVSHTARSWGGKANRGTNVKFYAHAKVPPPERIAFKFVGHRSERIGTSNVFQLTETAIVEAATVEDAFAKAERLLPSGVFYGVALAGKISPVERANGAEFARRDL